MKVRSDDIKKRRRHITTSIVTVAALVSVLVSFFIMRSGLPGMNILFYIISTIAVLLIVFLVIWNMCYSKKHARFALAARECYLIFLAVLLAGFATLQGLILTNGKYSAEDADVIIVLGAGIYGEVPSRILTSRLDAAADYLRSHKDAIVIVSGGQGRGESISEAEAMYRYLTRRGIDGSRILKEDKSTSTRENIEYSLALMDVSGLDPGDVKVGIVTNEFHLYRAKMIGRKLGLDAEGIPARTPYLTSRILYHCREAVALLFEFLRS